MSKIRIKNFGPINDGFTSGDGFLTINKITVFIGNQGTGKSSIAKLISVFSWLEKALYRGELKSTELTRYNRFVNTYCNYQNIKNYFTNETEIEFRGNIYYFLYKNKKLEIVTELFTSFEAVSPTNPVPQITHASTFYKVPKIMYVPAERNFLSAVENPDRLKGLPKSLSTFWDELQRSFQSLSRSLLLPIGKNVRFEYDKLNKIPRIVGSNFRLRLSEAASGFQSFVPLFLVSKYLSENINNEQGNTSKNLFSGEQQKKIQKGIEAILLNEELSAEFKENALKVLSSKYTNECFLNIVEEIEQNLFPDSQKTLLFKLLEFANSTRQNQLILTTHSPYIINYLTLAIQANHLLLKIKQNDQGQGLEEKLSSIVPMASCISPDDVAIYQLTDEGTITELPNYEGIPSDKNYLNESLAFGNELFDSLLEIEEELS